MPLRTQFTEDMKAALRAQDKVRLATLRLIQAEVKRADIALKTEGKGEAIDEPAILALLQRMIKQRQDTIAIYQQNNRPDAAAAEQGEIAILSAYLPPMKSAAETKALIKAKIAELGASGRADMGKVIANLKTTYPGALDMAQVSTLVKAALG